MLVRELAISYKATRRDVPPSLKNPADAVAWIRPHLDHEAVEVFLVVALDARHRPVCFRIVGRGTANAAPVHPRDVFLTAIASNAVAVIVAHNHPSGDPSPSSDDLTLTRRLIGAGTLLGIEVLDSLVIGCEGYHSHRDSGGFA